MRVQLRGPGLPTLLCLTGAAVMSAPAASDAAVLGLPVEGQDDAYVFQFFSDVDDVRVVTHQNAYGMDFDNGTALQLQILRQTVTVPAVEAAPGSQEAIDAITTASRPIRDIGDAYQDYSRTRHQFDLDVSRPNWAAGYYVSTEEDYFAQMIRAGYNRDFRGRTFNFSTGASYGWDRIDPVEDADSGTGADHRSTAYANAVGTWVLDRDTVLRVGVEHFRVSGLQHNPYRNVYVDGGNLPERHPDSRDRSDFYLRVHRYLPMRASIKLLWKHYFDDWGIGSDTIGARLSQYVGENVVVRYRYRYYRQDQADFYRDEYTEPGGVDGYRTGDFRMGAFDAHLFGTRIHWALRDVFARAGALQGLALQLSYERYFNSNNFSANILEAGFTLDF